MNQSGSAWKSVRLGLAILAGLVVYAYGFEVVKVDLNEFRKPTRAESRVRVTRALAKPDLFEFEQEEFIALAPIRVPCPTGDVEMPEANTSGAYMVLTPSCGDPGSEIRIEGFNFESGSGPLGFIPSSDPNHQISLQIGRVETQAQGQFVATVQLPQRPSDDLQYIRATIRRNVGAPRFSESARQTWDKIIETVFLALLATTLGTALAIPVSFIAAKNLMKGVRSPLSSVALAIIGWPVGIGLGLLAVQGVKSVSEMLSASVSLNAGGAIASPVVVWGVARLALRLADAERQDMPSKAARVILLSIAGLASVLAFSLAGTLAISIGEVLLDSLGASVRFLGNFIFQVGDIVGTITPALAAVVGGAVLSSVLGRIGQQLSERLGTGLVRFSNLLFASLAGAVMFAAAGAALNWLYQIGDPILVSGAPAGVGALLGLGLALRTDPGRALPIGLTIYYATRTILNAVRSVEPLIMAIVAVIWVGIGPFAGVIALAFHTVAALAKLYSEQVESILPGPIEAITATGANRLQTIVYAVIPQIVPPYISFTMYRWDINVRMSTIIGFAGGGGIGFLLQQNINLLNYRAASTQMLAIAIVVASMDYLSSTLRQRFV